MKKIAVITATRAEYGILHPLIKKIEESEYFELQLIVTGTHLEEKYGYTKREIEEDQLPIFECIPILEKYNTCYDISITMANAIKNFATYFKNEKPDLLIVLGDRTEILGICCAAMNERIPIAHLHGGELTQGAVDDCIRHALTKMSYLHFPSTEVYRQRIIQMGENPERVFNVGALGVENILNIPLLSCEKVCKNIGIPQDRPYVVITFHSVTLEEGNECRQVEELIVAMKKRPEYFYLITKANADVGGEIVNQIFEELSLQEDNVKLVPSLGMLRYLSAVKYAAFVMGNSSSGIIEAPALGTPTVNIGTRQQGRIMAESIVNCSPKTEEILNAMKVAEKIKHKPSLLYGDGNTSEKIISVIKDFLYNDKIDLKKVFWDIKE